MVFLITFIIYFIAASLIFITIDMKREEKNKYKNMTFKEKTKIILLIVIAFGLIITSSSIYNEYN